MTTMLRGDRRLWGTFVLLAVAAVIALVIGDGEAAFVLGIGAAFALVGAAIA